MKKLLVFIICLFITIPVFARDVAGVKIDESITLADTPLVLNGSGIRSKFFFSIFIGSLYLTEKSSEPETIYSNTKPKRVVMNVLYEELPAEKIINGWVEGFKNNNDAAAYASLEERLKQFNQFFGTSKKGDAIVLDYIPEEGTKVIINTQLKGTIPGQDFNTALLKVWLGESPADSNLKEAMLGLD